MTVLENIMLAPVEVKKLSRPQVRNKALELLDRVGPQRTSTRVFQPGVL